LGGGAIRFAVIVGFVRKTGIGQKELRDDYGEDGNGSHDYLLEVA
jgi:hypothetical protein